MGYAPIVIEAPVPLDDDLAGWVADMLLGNPATKSGVVVMLDYAGKERSRLEWTAGHIVSVGFPAADAADKSLARVAVAIQPTETLLAAGSQATYAGSGLGSAKGIKTAVVSNFAFSLSGLAAASNKVAGVSAITVTRRPDGVLELPELSFRLPAAEAAPFDDWFATHVLVDQDDERSATLEFLSSSLGGVLLRVELEGVGVVRVVRERQQQGVEVLPMVRVDAYCEAVRLGPVTPAPAAPAVAPAAPAPPPGGGGAADPVIALLEAVTHALRDGAGTGSARTVDEVAARLLASRRPEPAAGDADRGRAAGRAWASDRASLDELDALAALADRDDWVAVALADGHSLPTFLAGRGDTAALGSGALDLARDDFTAGVVAGAAEVRREVAPRLRERRDDRSADTERTSPLPP